MAETRRPATVDADKLHLILGLKSGDAALLSWQDQERLANLKFAVKQAELVGRVQRFARKDPRTHETLGYCYLRDEIVHLIKNRG